MYLFKKSGLVIFLLLTLNSMAQIKKPGVFVQEITALPPSVVQVETAIPAFIGYTEKADEKAAGDLFFKGKRVSTITEYEKYFGKGYHLRPVKLVLDNNYKVSRTELDNSGHLLYESLKNYFNNGGGPCYIFSTGNYSRQLRKADLIAGLTAANKLDEITLLVLPDAVNLQGADLYAVQQQALEQAGKQADRFCILDLKYAGDLSTHRQMVGEFRAAITGNQLKFGAAYTPYIKTIVNQEYTYREWKDIIWVIDKQVKLQEVITDPVFVQQLAELEQLIATNSSAALQKEKEMLARFPEMKAIADKMRQAELALPPSGAIAGVYCSVDRTRGVWKAPANVALYGYNKPILSFNDRLQEELNVDVTTGKSINVIREFSGRGTQVWGARTLAGNDNEWRYVPVRRFYITVEESIKKATDRFVFEPNDANTWTRIKSMIENYLVLKWREGALVGTKPEQAFFVNVGLGKTMTNQDILEGRLIVEVGMAAVRPAEFIILKFQLKMVTK